MIERRWPPQNPPLMDTPGTASIPDTHQFEGGIREACGTLLDSDPEEVGVLFLLGKYSATRRTFVGPTSSN